MNLAEVWAFRDLLVRFMIRDLKLRYRQTALGVIWVVLQPLIAAGVFAFVFGRVANLDSEGVPYFAFAFAGMLGWNVFSQILTRMSVSLTGNAALVSKIYFPRLVLPFSTVGAVLIDFVVALGMMAVILVSAEVWAGAAILTLPLWLAGIIVLATGVGLAAAALMVPYRDVQYILPVAVQTLLFASPVAYSLSNVPESAQTIFKLNPVTGFLEGLRWSLLGVGEPDGFATGWAFGAAIVIFLGGALVFTRMERRFADVI